MRKGRFSWKWIRRLALFFVVAGVLVWQWPTITRWASNLAGSIWEALGWGLILIVAGLLIALIIIFRHRIARVARAWHLNTWNWWLGGIAFALAIWGSLAFFDLGGSVGVAILGTQNALLGVLRLVGLVVLGIVLIAPRRTWRALVSVARALKGLFQRPKREVLPPSISDTKYLRSDSGEDAFSPVKGLSPAEKPASKITPPITLIPPEGGGPRRGEAIEQPQNVAQKPKDVTQVAQEVWRKYGAISNLAEIDGWKLPPVDILDQSPELGFNDADNQRRAALIEDALASYGVDARVEKINPGPAVTQFGVSPGWDIRYKEVKERDKDGNIVTRQQEVSRTRVKVDRITSLANDLAMALAVPELRIEAPVPGQSLVGIEVPNSTASVVSLRSVIESIAFRKILARSKLALALGKGAGGEAVAADLTRMPHLLIAGATGSGKTVCLNAIISCLLMFNSPTELRFIMIDPKRVELTAFNSLPHLATPVIVDVPKALGALRWLKQEMDNRYKKLATEHARNIEAFNKARPQDKFPYIVLIIDELADLMMVGSEEVEELLCRLAQMARAVGIHLVVATQRPSVDVITGLIKANFPTRISFAVTSQVDSRTILDMAGAEKLLGRGDMLYLPTEAAKPKRLQGCFVSDAEIERLTYFWNSQKPEEKPTSLKVEDLSKVIVTTTKGPPLVDPLLESARQLAQEHKQISTSFLQRRLRIGYPRAARLMEQLQEEAQEDKLE